MEVSQPDVLLLDLTLPGGGSLDLIRELRDQTVSPRIIVLTMHDDPAYARSALMAGAVGYVVKTVGEQELLDAVRSVAQGRVIIDLDDATKTASVYSHIGRPGSATGLSERELEVLTFLGQGYSNLEVAAIAFKKSRDPVVMICLLFIQEHWWSKARGLQKFWQPDHRPKWEASAKRFNRSNLGGQNFK
ncbi:MAG: response regulator transcription factor [Aureliella sp.]